MSEKESIVSAPSGEKKIPPALPIFILIILVIIVGGAWLNTKSIYKMEAPETIHWSPPETDNTLLLKQDSIKAALIEQYNTLDYISEFRKSMDDNPDNISDVLNDAIAKFAKNNDFVALINLYDVVVFEYPAGEFGFIRHFNNNLRDNRQKLYEFEKALLKRIEEEPHAVHYTLASISARSRRDYLQAAQYLSEAVKRSGDNQKNYSQLAEDYLNCHDFERAIILNERIMELSDDMFARADDLIKLYTDTGRKEKIIRWLNDLPEKKEFSTDQWRIVAEFYYAIEDYQNALNAVTEAYISNPDKPEEIAFKMIPLFGDIIDALETYELPQRLCEYLHAGDQASIMLYLAEHYTRMEKYYIEIGYYRTRNQMSLYQNSHNFPAAALVMENLEKSGLSVPDKYSDLYYRLKAAIAHYSGDIESALEYYSRQTENNLLQEPYFRRLRSRSIMQDAEKFINFLSRKDFPGGNGEVKGKLRFHDKPLAGITVALSLNSNSQNNRGSKRFNHPLQPNFYSYSNELLIGAQTMTDQAGEFVFKDMPYGPYDIIFVLDNAVIDPDAPEAVHRIMGYPPDILLGAGQKLDLGWIDVVKQIKIIEPEEDYIAYDYVLRIAWDWKPPSHLKNYSFIISITDNFGLRRNEPLTVLYETLGSDNYFDFDLEHVFPGADLSVYIAVLDSGRQTLSHKSFDIAYPKYRGLTKERDEIAGSIGVEAKRSWWDHRYEEFAVRAEKLCDEFPDSTIADDALFMAASAWQELGNKEMAEKAYALFFERYPDSPLMIKRKQIYPDEFNIAAKYAEFTGGDEKEIRESFDANARKSRKPFRENPMNQTSISPVIFYISKTLSWIFIVLSCVLLIAIIQLIAVRKR